MFEKIQISNFQSHRKTELEFHPGVNTIIGSSDSGKTAILRALRWAVWNKPLGDAFRSSWGGDTIVRIKSYNGTLERFKGKSDHYRLYDNPEVDPMEFKAFGTSVPDEVQKHLNLSEINLQTQHDSHFLLSDSPGEVARYFNKIARIDQIDKGLQNVEKWTRQLKSDIGYHENQVESLKEQIKSLDYIEAFEKKVNEIEKLEAQKVSKENNLEQLKASIEEITNLKEEIADLSDTVSAEKRVDSLLDLFKQKEQVQGHVRQLKELVDEIKQTSEEIDSAQQTVVVEEEIDRIIKLYDKRDKKEEKIQELESTVTQIENVKKGIQTQQKTLKDLEKQWHEEFPGVCPLCNQTVKQ